VPVAPRTRSNGSFGGFAAMVIYLRALLASLSIRASDFVVWKIWHLRGVVPQICGSGKAVAE